MKNGINFILFQSLWLSCVLGAANQNLWAASIIVCAMLVVFILPDFRNKKDKIFLSVCIILGFTLDSIMAHFDLIEYNYSFGISNFAPIWILFLWIGFALTLNHSMTWLLKKPRLGTLFIVLGAPLSYFSAERLGAIQINESIITLSLISVMWLMVYHIILAIDMYNFEKQELNHV